MTLEEAIIHCKEKACDNSTQCALEHRQLAEWLEELQQYRKNTRKKQNLTEIKVVYPNNPKRKEIGFYYNKKEVSWEDILLVDRMHDYPYYFRDGMDYYPFMPDTNLG